MSAKALILAGYGLNCEEETLYAFNYVGMEGDIVHINDVIENPKLMNDYQTLVVPGGFSYGDDTGSGNAFAQKMKLSLWDNIREFVERDTLTLGICNGCQILANLGLVPGSEKDFGARTVAVTYNENARYQCRWVDTKVGKTDSPWLNNIKSMHIPVAHGEGRFMMEDAVLKSLKKNKQIALQYVRPDGDPADGTFPYNPNGSLEDIAGITDQSGRIFALMPHPERGMFTWQRDDFHELKDAAQRKGEELPEKSDGIALFKNAARYFGITKKQEKAA